jgi:UDP-N-acetylmuramoyl-tripeptide--D-alanyl-D-alanine ligase
MRPWHRYAVIEVGTEGPGQIWKKAALIRPNVAIELAVAGTHANAFPTLDDTAAEKGALLEYIRADGIAILNGDDARVRGMADRCKANLVFFGQTDDCDFVAEDVGSAWPERLHFSARSADGQTQVQTQLVGTHWLSSALAALVTARACGIPMAAAAIALAKVTPFAGRMQPVELPSGAILIRDETNGSFDALEAMFKVVREAQAMRRILVISDIADSKVRSRHRLRDLGRIAAELVDVIVFVGEHGRHGPPAAIGAGMNPEDCYYIASLKDAAEFLLDELRAGDLVFLGGRGNDHLTRIMMAQFGPIGCWKTDCRLRSICDACPQLLPSFDLGIVRTLPPSQPIA